MRRGVLVLLAVLAAPLGAQTPYTPAVGTVAQLPTCDSTRNGRSWTVTNALTPAIGSAATAGGAERVTVVCDSSVPGWVIHTTDSPSGGGAGDVTDVGDCATGACFQSTTATHVFAAPSGGGVAAFRALVDADVPNTITIDLATTATTANAGDSATAFFLAGTIEAARLPAASESAAGIVELATSAETTAGLAVQASDTRLSDSRAPSGAAGGDLGGTYPNPTVDDDGHEHTGVTLSGIDASDDTNLSAGVGLAFSSDAFALTFADAGTDPALGAAGATFSNEGASAAGLVFEGDTNDEHETRVRVTDPTAERIVTIPNADSTTVQPDTGAANNFLTAISAAGVVSKAQPTFSNLSGSATDAQVDGSAEADEVQPTLGTQTQGNYLATLADDGQTTITVTGSGSESAAVTLRVVDVVCTGCLSPTELAADAVGASEVANGAIDDVANLTSGVRTGVDAKVVTGTAGATDDCAKWNADGDLVSAGAACGSGGGATVERFQWAGSGMEPVEPAADSIAPLAIVTGSNNDNLVRLHDASTDECVKAPPFELPSTLDTSGDAVFWLRTKAATAPAVDGTNDDADWYVKECVIGDGETDDCTPSAHVCVTQDYSSTQDFSERGTCTLSHATLDWAGLDLVQLYYCRDADDGSNDTLPGDAELQNAGVEVDLQ